jgi:NAD(P)-dependent dehydrogenase (short-subunit alcohol dehydrogenase family)
MSSNKAFSGKVALVIGGTSGIGEATVHALAAAGARVVFAGRRTAEGAAIQRAVDAAGGTSRFIETDAAREEDVKSLVYRTVAQYGRLDLAFNNAGADIFGPLTDITEEDYRRLFDVNVWGVIAAMKYEITAMLKTGGGAIVNTSSTAGHVGAPGFALYTASKHAVEGVSKAAALEFGRQSIRVNTIVPGFITTPMFERHVAGSEERRSGMASTVPVGRIGDADEVAKAVLYLLSDAASYVTGDSLKVDGGWLAQ